VHGNEASVALVIQHATHMRRTLPPPVACLAIPYFSALPHKRYDFRINVIEPRMFFDFREIPSYLRKRLHVKSPLFSSLMKLEFSRQIFGGGGGGGLKKLK
jgi:hypothetical protein